MIISAVVNVEGRLTLTLTWKRAGTRVYVVWKKRLVYISLYWTMLIDKSIITSSLDPVSIYGGAEERFELCPLI
jgi:hypothetical protein